MTLISSSIRRRRHMKPPSQALAGISGDEYAPALVAYLRSLFHFLIVDYDCAEAPPGGDREVRFVNSTTLVVIRSEWQGPWVALDHAKDPKHPVHGSLPIGPEFYLSFYSPLFDATKRYEPLEDALEWYCGLFVRDR